MGKCITMNRMWLFSFLLCCGLLVKLTESMKWGIFFNSTVPIDIPWHNSDRLEGTAIKRSIPTRIVHDSSWMWRNLFMDGRTTSLQIYDTVPNAIGGYYVSGFALSPTLGLSKVQIPQKFIVKKQFFMIANLPYFIERDEEVLISVTVFNFLGFHVTALVTLLNSNEEIEFVGNGSDDLIRQRKTVLILDNKAQSVSFMIKPNKIGPIKIKFEASSNFASDVIEHVLRVMPESHRYEKMEDRYFELDYSQVEFNFTVHLPRYFNERSLRIVLKIDSGWGLSNNIDTSILKLTGSDQQHIWIFSQNILILEYLAKIKNLAEQDKITMIKDLKRGYQNLLMYKHSDGSFNIGGRSNTKDSIFSTAMVAISLLKAAQYIDVDEQVVNSTFKWLASVQTTNGRFEEVGGSSDLNMQGALLPTKYALTSYVLMAFGENQEIAEKYRTVVEKTAQYLVNNVHNMNDVYDLSMATYGLSLIKHQNQLNFLSKLIENSINDQNITEMYWNRPPVSIEVSGYALLSYIEAGMYRDAIAIDRWLSKQLNGLTSSSRTQDKFVGLNALATFAARHPARRNDYLVTLSAGSTRFNPSRDCKFDIVNAEVYTQEIPSQTRILKVQLQGSGSGKIQFKYQYKLNMQFEKPSFNLTTQLLNTSTYDVQHLEVCLKYIPKEPYEHSNMALVEIFLPSGLIAEADSITDITKHIKKIERRFSNTSVVVYYEHLNSQWDCFQVTTNRRFTMALHMLSYVTVYDYHQRDRFAIASYEGKVLQLGDDCEGEDCESGSIQFF